MMAQHYHLLDNSLSFSPLKFPLNVTTTLLVTMEKSSRFIRACRVISQIEKTTGCHKKKLFYHALNVDKPFLKWGQERHITEVRCCACELPGGQS